MLVLSLIPLAVSQGAAPAEGRGPPAGPPPGFREAAAGSAEVAGRSAAAGAHFAIRVVDEATGRGVPLVELRTTNDIAYWTDSAGVVAFREPGLMGRKVFFFVKSHGYEFPADGFGFRGTALTTTPGGSAVVKLRRLNVAERLYRVTGGGIYRDSAILGLPVPIREPLLNGQVVGQDSVMPVIYRGKIYWFWGDTNRPSYPLGHFGTSGAVSALPGRGGLDPSVGVDLTYFVDDAGFSRPMCDVPGPGMKWIGGLLVLPDPDGRERLLAKYASHKSLGEIYESGLLVYDDEKEAFVPLLRFPENVRLYPDGRPFRCLVGGEEYAYFSWPYPVPCVRVRAEYGHVTDPTRYEAFTPIVTGRAWEKGKTEIERDREGRPVYRWRRHTHALDRDRIQELIAAGALRPEEAPYRFTDVETGREIQLRGSAHWNDYRGRWILIGVESWGTPSFLGEVWYAEGDTPLGPWVYARRIITHEKYSFYWPGHHPFFDQDAGRIIYLEGTYTEAFSGNPEKTPRYNYNQVMYRLALDDPRLALPAPVYRIEASGGGVRYLQRRGVEDPEGAAGWEGVKGVPFFAVEGDRGAVGFVPISGRNDGSAPDLHAGPPSEREEVLFLALPAKAGAEEKPSEAVLPLYEHLPEGGGPPLYDVAEAIPGYVRAENPLCRVWRNPLSLLLIDAGVVPAP